MSRGSFTALVSSRYSRILGDGGLRRERLDDIYTIIIIRCLPNSYIIGEPPDIYIEIQNHNISRACPIASPETFLFQHDRMITTTIITTIRATSKARMHLVHLPAIIRAASGVALQASRDSGVPALWPHWLHIYFISSFQLLLLPQRISRASDPPDHDPRTLWRHSFGLGCV